MKVFSNLVRKLKSLFTRAPKAPASRTKSSVQYGDKVGNVTITQAYQLDKHVDFKVGESYKVGEAIVTLHANKASMLAAIAKVNANRKAHEAYLTKRGEDIMLMTPQELAQFKVNEWLAANNSRHSFIKGIVGTIASIGRYIRPHKDAFTPPSGKKDERIAEQFKEVMKDVKVVDKV